MHCGEVFALLDDEIGESNTLTHAISSEQNQHLGVHSALWIASV